MKYAVTLITGISLGILMAIFGEVYIPKKLYFSTGYCIKDSSGLVYLPEFHIYNSKLDPYPIPLAGHVSLIPSYMYARALIIKDISYLSNDKCNELTEKYLTQARRIK